MIRGYKSFSYNGTNQANEVMEAGKKYHCAGKIKYNHNGYHMAARFEDTIPFSDIVNEKGEKNLLHDVIIAEVIGSGVIDEVSEVYANYYGYYHMYACSDIEIVKFVSRKDLINMALELNSERMKRFVSYYKLTEEEIKLFRGLYPDVDAAIEYYQEDNKEIYNPEKYKNLVLKFWAKNKI